MPPTKKRRYKPAQVADALREAKGFVSVAARMLGCQPGTVRNYIGWYPEVRQAVEDAREGMIDLAEGRLFQKIQEGDNVAIIFFLKTQAKHRGYVERQELTGRGGDEFVIKVEYGNGDGGGYSQTA